MHTIHYENEVTIENADPALTLLDISLQNNIPHVHACGGHARCSTCRIAIVKNPENFEDRNEAECELAQAKGLGPEIRLACQARVTGPVTIRRLVIDDEDLRAASETSISGQEQQLAILFSDIRSFTPFTEQNLPYDVVHIMNRYFRRMGDAIQRNNGYIDKYIGDGLMALFGLEEAAALELDLSDPAQRARHARIVCRSAVQAALDMQDELVEVNRYLQNHLAHEFRIGVGIHFGDVIVGEMGHPDKRQFTALGDNVNTASRIESVTKKAAVPLLISQEVHDILERDLTIHKRFRTKLKGKSGDYRLYSVTGVRVPDNEAPARLDRTGPPPAAGSSSTISQSVVNANPGAHAPALRRFDLPVIEILEAAEDTMAFLLDTGGQPEFRFRPGQYVNVRLPDIDGSRIFSIASASRIKDFILIATRIRKSEFKQAMRQLKIGDVLSVGEPEGDFGLPDDPGQPLVFIAGGIGITPIRSMIEEMVDTQVDRPLLVFYSNRSPDAAAFESELGEWINHMPHGKLVRIYSRVDQPPAEHGRFNGAILHRHLKDFQQMLRDKQPGARPPLFYVVGPDVMTLDAVALLEREGVPADSIRLEAFYGYG